MAEGTIGDTVFALPAGDGTRLVGSAWVPASPPRAILVVVHGLKDHVRRYAALADRMSAAGIATYGADLRGHGRSEGARVWVRRFDEYLDDLDVVLREVGSRHPGTPVLVFGHSMGAAIVGRYALERSPRWSGVIFSAPAFRPGGKVSRAAVAITKLLSAIAPHASVFRLPNPDFSRDPDVVRAMDADPLIYQRPAPARTAAELIRAMSLIAPRAAAFTLPVLVLHGTADRVTDPEGSRAFVASAGSESKTLRTYEGLFHDLLHEPERAQVLDEIARWTESRSVAAAPTGSNDRAAGARPIETV